MGREIRKVSPDWEHPVDEQGQYIPLRQGDFDRDLAVWVAGLVLWQNGKHPSQKDFPQRYWWQVNGEPPCEDEYMPLWHPKQATCVQLYETTTDGTPISPVFSCPDEMLRWMIADGYSHKDAQSWIDHAISECGWGKEEDVRVYSALVESSGRFRYHLSIQAKSYGGAVDKIPSDSALIRIKERKAEDDKVRRTDDK